MRVKGLLTTAWLAVSLSSVLGSVLRSGDVAPGITSRAASQDSAPLLRAASQDDIRKAREMVDKAMEEAAKLNEARMAHPFRNQHHLSARGVRNRRDTAVPVPPLLEITPELAAAAALVAEADAAAKNTSAVLHKRGTYWMQDIERKGTSPWGDDADYKIFRNVKDYGAKGDGSSDDTKAINKAIMDGKRCGDKCNGSTVKNAVIYFPPGTYLVSNPIVSVFGTQMIGDYNDRPTIKGTSGFIGLGIISTDEYVGNGAGTDGKDNEWYVNTANFYRTIRNLKVDVSDVKRGHPICAIHYQVAQATSMHNIEITAKTDSTQRGIFAENGSGGLLSDITVNGGAYGLFGGAQQFTAIRMTFNKCNTAVQLIWDWGWLWKTLHIFDCKIGMRLVSEDSTGNIGSISVLDSVFRNLDKGVVVDQVSSDPGTGTTGLVFHTVVFDNVAKAVVDLNDTLLWDGKNAADSVNTKWFMGPGYDEDGNRKWDKRLYDYPVGLTPLLHGNDREMGAQLLYTTVERKAYQDKSVGDFIHLKDFATGDGKTDDTTGVQKAFDSAGDKIIFADAGIYMLTDTVTIPEGTRIMGEAWTQFAATGDKFGNADKPIPMLRVGSPDNSGKTVEMQDLIFTSKGPTPGAILVEWNMAPNKDLAHSAMWDCHVRLGGAKGTELTPAECPALKTGEVKEGCKVASMLMHIPKNAAGYFENVWLWVADHMIDDPDLNDDKNEMTMISVYSARGLLVESQGPVWLFGTASEHSVMYQYNFNSAVNVFAGLLQTESPYYQPSPKAPAPFEKQVFVFDSDPAFICDSGDPIGCDSAWGLIITNSTNVHVAAAGIYSWFSTYSEDCIDAHACQAALVDLAWNNENILITNLVTIGAKNSIISNGELTPAMDNLAVKSHPSWSQISYFAGSSFGGDDGDGEIPLPDCSQGPLLWRSNLNALATSISDEWLHCAAEWTMRILFRTLVDSLQRYKDEDEANYDGKFKVYGGKVDDGIGPGIEKAMDIDHGECNKYFTCTMEIKGKDVWSKTCPFTRIDTINYSNFSTRYELKDAAGFNKTLADKYGILPDWVKFGDTEPIKQPDGGRVNDKNRPMKADNPHIINPKDAIVKSLDGYVTLLGTILSAQWDLATGGWDTADTHPMEAFVLPVSMLTDAVDQMRKIAIIGQEEIDKDTEGFIMDIINAVLMVIPFVGEVTGPLIGLTEMIGRIITLFDLVGQGAVSFYDLAAHPENAAMDFFGLMVGVGTAVKGFGREAREMDDLMNKRRLIKDDEIDKMGPTAKKNNELIQSMKNKCYRKP